MNLLRPILAGVFLFGAGESFGAAWQPAQPWWDNYPLIVQSASAATVQALGGDAGFTSFYGDPSWGLYCSEALRTSAGWGDRPAQMHAAGLHYFSYYETFGTGIALIAELLPAQANGFRPWYRTRWSWSLKDTQGGEFRWPGPHTFFDADVIAGPFTRFHPVFGAGARAMTYPDGSNASGHFDNDVTDPRKSRVIDAGSAKSVLGVPQWAYGFVSPEVQANPLRNGGLLPVTENGATSLAASVSFGKDMACPMWIDLHRSSVRFSASNGVDGIWADNFGAFDSVGHPPVKAAFGDWSVARFRQYLAQKFTSTDLSTMGVSNVATFDVRAYVCAKLISLGGVDTNLGDSAWKNVAWFDDAVWRAYRIFKRQVGTEALDAYDAASKAAAADAGRDDFVVLGNDIPVYSLGFVRGNLDMVSTELSPGYHFGTSQRGFMMPPIGRFAPAYRAAREHARSRLVNVWMYLENPYKEAPGAVNTIYYEMLANGALPMLYEGSSQVTQSREINGAFFSFVRSTRGVFGAREAAADVAIYYSTSSILSYLSPGGFPDISAQPFTGAYNGWATALGALHQPYRALPEWKLTRAELDKYRVLVIPHAEVLDTADVTNIIDPWVRAGGRLIVTGNSAARQGEGGNFALYGNGNIPLSPLTGIPGYPPSSKDHELTHVIGSGRVYYNWNNLGLDYFSASTSAERAALIGTFTRAMSEALGTTQLLLTKETSVPETTGLNLYEDAAARRVFLDVNNYNLELASDVVTPTGNFAVNLRVPAWLAPAQTANLRATLLTPQAVAPAVTLSRIGDRVRVEVAGPITHYASIVIMSDVAFSEPVVMTPASDASTATSVLVTVTFPRPVTGFTATDLVPTNAAVQDFAGSGTTYTFTLVRSGTGPIGLTIPEGAAIDELGYATLAGALAYTAVTPVIAPSGGEYNFANLSVTATSATSGAILRYTLDGTDPVESSPLVPVSGIALGPPRMLKVRAWKEGLFPSEVGVAGFTIPAFARWAGTGTVATTDLVRAYAIGGAPSSTARGQEPIVATVAQRLVLTALVRVDDEKLSVAGETTATLTGIWTTTGVLVERAQDQSNVPSGFELRNFSVPLGGVGFLRLRATLAP